MCVCVRVFWEVLDALCSCLTDFSTTCPSSIFLQEMETGLLPVRLVWAYEPPLLALVREVKCEQLDG